MGDPKTKRTEPIPLPTDLFDSSQLVTNPVELITYEVDAGFDRGKPDGAIYPHSSEDVSKLVRWSHEHGVPLIAAARAQGYPARSSRSWAGLSSSFRR